MSQYQRKELQRGVGGVHTAGGGQHCGQSGGAALLSPPHAGSLPSQEIAGELGYPSLVTDLMSLSRLTRRKYRVQYDKQMRTDVSYHVF